MIVISRAAAISQVEAVPDSGYSGVLMVCPRHLVAKCRDKSARRLLINVVG
jgi:hypothetical protein